MKPRYHGIFSVVLFAATLLIGGVYYYSGWWRSAGTRIQGTPAPPAHAWVPSSRQIDAMQQLAAELPMLASPAARAGGAASLQLFGQRAETDLQEMTASRQVNEEIVHHLSLTLMAGPVRYCIIDGDFYTEGAQLPDGAVVVAIDHQRVLLVRNDTMQWITMDHGEARTDGPLSTKGKGLS